MTRTIHEACMAAKLGVVTLYDGLPYKAGTLSAIVDTVRWLHEQE